MFDFTVTSILIIVKGANSSGTVTEFFLNCTLCCYERNGGFKKSVCFYS